MNQIFFSDALRKLRIKKGLTQKELAEEMFVTRSTIARWESGSRMPDAVALYTKRGYTLIPNYPPYDQLDGAVCYAKIL